MARGKRKHVPVKTGNKNCCKEITAEESGEKVFLNLESTKLDDADDSDHFSEEGNSSEDDSSVYSGLEDNEKTDSDDELTDAENENEFGSDSEHSELEKNSETGDEVDNKSDNKFLKTKEIQVENKNEEESSGDKRVKKSSESKLKKRDQAVEKNKKNVNGTLQKSSKKPVKINENIENAQFNALPDAKSDEYDYDTSDEEDIRNTVGNIPMEWYDEFPHIGYDWDGKKIMKPATKDELDKFLDRMEDPNYWRTVKDKSTGQDVVITNEDIDIIQRIQTGRCPDSSYNPYKNWADIYSHEVEIHPLTNAPAHKRSFIPSLIEKEKVGKLIHAIKQGWILPRRKTKKPSKPKFYLLWDDEKTEISKRMQYHMPAPKLKPPGHEESYNPPPEYLFSPEQLEKWKSQEPEDRQLNFIPQKYDCLRHVPGYSNFIRERFDRCLDLYLCPRQRKMRLNVDPEDLIPKLPKAKDLQPFPTTLSIIYKGHEGAVHCITVDPSGQYLASGSEDKTIKFWEVSSGYCLKTLPVSDKVQSVAWCSNSNVCLVAAAVNNTVLILNPGLADHLIVSSTDSTLTATLQTEQGKSSLEWKKADEGEWAKGIRLIIEHPKEVKQVTWHGRGDYFASVMPNSGSASVQVHQLTRRMSQQPFNKPKGLVQCVLFHPSKPLLFVATQQCIRIYNLVKQELFKKLSANCKWISSMAIHPAGDNIITGSYDPRLSWFDMDLSTKPYKIIRHQKYAIRQVAFHKRFPLFASASDDCTVLVSHGQVYNDLLKNPLIVPVKELKGHKKANDLGVLDCQFHPNSPWLFSAGSDGKICLFT